MIRHTATVQTANTSPTRWQAVCPTCQWRGIYCEQYLEATAEACHHNDTAQPLEASTATQELADEDGSRAERTFHAFTRGLEGVERGAEARRRLQAALDALARNDTLANRTRIEPARPAFTSEDV